MNVFRGLRVYPNKLKIDPFAERVFYLDVVEIIPTCRIDKPEVLRSVGAAPKQVESFPNLEITPKANTTVSDDMEEDEFYGSDSYNSDEFDPEGFEVSSEVNE